MSIFKSSTKNSQHYKNLLKLLRSIKSMTALEIRSKDERKFEDRIAGLLSDKFKSDFVDQRNTQQTITRVTMFDHDHRPDMSIGHGKDKLGMAIEVKVAKSGDSFRQAIGQAFKYSA